MKWLDEWAKRRVGRAKSMNFGGYGGGSQGFFGGPFRRLPGSNFDYRTEAGNPWDNSIIAASINWATKCFPQARVRVERFSNGRWNDEPNHPSAEILRSPNPYYDSSLLMSGYILSRIVDGNSYFRVELGGLLNVKSIYYLPHFAVSPVWDSSGNDFISSYLYRPAGSGKSYMIPDSEVIHCRFGIDPLNIRKGMSPIASLLREICTDNEASTAAGALMRNMGMGGLAFTPGVEVDSMNEAQNEMLSRLIREKTTGERRGEPIVASLPGKWDRLNPDPENMALDAIRKVPEQRICGAIGISPIVLGLGSGLENSTYANFQEALRAAYEGFLAPTWDSLGHDLTVQLLPLYGHDPNDWRIRFDYTEVPGLSENVNEVHDRVRRDWMAGLITRSEARFAFGLTWDPSRDDIFFESSPQQDDVLEASRDIVAKAYESARTHKQTGTGRREVESGKTSATRRRDTGSGGHSDGMASLGNNISVHKWP